MTRFAAAAFLFTVCAATGATAGSVGFDALTSSDSDGVDTAQAGLNLDWRYASAEDYQGVRLEAARFRSAGQDDTELRAYYRFARKDAAWSWNGQVGTDGHTLLGGLNVHNASRYRQEYFVERDLVATPQGIDRGLYYTLVGGALDVPLSARDTVTVMAGLQDFTGHNIRTHLRASYIRELAPAWGLTGQLRARYFHNSRPREFDYFSPREFLHVLPTLQVRNHLGAWRYQVAAGLGVQRQTGEGWRAARAFNARLTSPPIRKTWSVEAAIAYTNSPGDAGYGYDYRQFSVGLRRSF
jgi:hypothetical protein